MAFRAPIGISDFVQLRESDAYYVDKTSMVTQILASPTRALLLPRPRRFGKTLNLSTLRYFLEKGPVDRSALFEGLEVWSSDEARRHFQRYPVIYLTFKDVKAPSWELAYAAIRRIVAAEARRHRAALEPVLSSTENEDLNRLERAVDDASLHWGTLGTLSEQLARATGRPVAILIDEYDIPIQAAYANGYYDEAVTFFRNFLSAGLKDNPHLFRGVLTGVLRVAKESIFSGLNNVAVRSIFNAQLATAFGFTEAELHKLCEDAGMPDMAEELRRWYNGYTFANHTIYNPWSVLCFAAERDMGFRPYWVFTSSEDVLRGLLLERGHRMDEELGTLLRGGTVPKVVSEHVVLRELDQDRDAAWNLLVLSGYLTARNVELVRGRLHAQLAIPNEEVRIVFEESVTSWVSHGVGGRSAVQALLRAMLGGDEKSFGGYLGRLVGATFSYHDVGGREPERVYQAFILGLLVHLEPTHHVRSNRESGWGRYDIAVSPKKAGEPGVVVELKSLDEGESVDDGLTSALAQIEERGYTAELVEAGAEPIVTWAAVFDGKRVWVRRG